MVTSVKITSHFPVFPGANTKPEWESFPRFDFICCKQVAWSRPGSAASTPGRGSWVPRAREARPALQERRGTFLRRARETMPAPALRAGRAPHRRGPPLGALSRPLSGGRAEPPREAPLAPPRPTSVPPLGVRHPGPCRARSRSPPQGQGQAARSPPSAPSRRLSTRGPGRGAKDPGRPRRTRPGAPQLTRTGRAAGHYSIAGWAPAPGSGADARAPAPSAERSRLSERNAGLQPPERRAGQGRGPGCPSAECPPAAGAARRGPGGERGAGRGGRPCAEGRRPQRCARLGGSRSAAEGAGFRKSKHFDRKSGS